MTIPDSTTPLSTSGRYVIFVVASLGWLCAGLHMSITQLTGQPAAIDLLTRSGELDGARFQALSKQAPTKAENAFIEQPAIRDAAMIAAANRVEHYEIAAYGTARTLATSLGLSQSPRLLEQTLDEEKKADAKLTQIAEQTVNQQAMRPKTRHAR